VPSVTPHSFLLLREVPPRAAAVWPATGRSRPGTPLSAPLSRPCCRKRSCPRSRLGLHNCPSPPSPPVPCEPSGRSRRREPLPPITAGSSPPWPLRTATADAPAAAHDAVTVSSARFLPTEAPAPACSTR